MTNKIYYLSTCSTCQRIMTELGLDDEFEKQDIKAENINEADLNVFAKQAGSYWIKRSILCHPYRSNLCH